MKISLNYSVVALVVPFMLLMFSCSGTMDEQDYVRWVQDYENGLHVERITGEFVFDLQYLPAEYRQLQVNNGRAISLSHEQHPDELQYYRLIIGTKDERKDFIESAVTNEFEKQQRLYYFSYHFQDDIYLQEDNQKKRCELYHFERVGTLKHERVFMVAFEQGKLDSEAIFTIDSPPFGSIPVKIRISKSKIPKLKL